MADDIAALCTLQMSWGGLLDGQPADDYAVHLVRQKKGGGTPGPTLCGIDRFAEDAPGWSVGGGLSGPGIIHKPCPGCAAVAREQFPGLPVAGMVGATEIAAELGVEATRRSAVPRPRETAITDGAGMLTCDGCLHAPATLLAAMGRTNADRTRAPGHALRLLCGDCADRTRVICELAGRAVTFLPLGLEPGTVTEWGVRWSYFGETTTETWSEEGNARACLEETLASGTADTGTPVTLLRRGIGPWKEVTDGV